MPCRIRSLSATRRGQILDKLLGPVDEWLTSRLISQWREDVWDNAVRYLALADAHERDTFQVKIEFTAMRRGEDILDGIL